MIRNKLNRHYAVLILASLTLIPECLLATEANASKNNGDTLALTEREYSFGEVVRQSVFGDVYSDPSQWQELSLGNFFSKGWDKPWVSPPTGGGGAPRQGWLNAYEGVFYRLSLGVFGWQHSDDNGDGYSGNLVSFTPFNQRFEIQTEVPVSSNDNETNFGDLRIQGRFLLSETRDVTQTFNISFRIPTGDYVNGNEVASVIPQYQFWANWWKGLVVRGGAGFTIPYSGEIGKAGARSTFDANLSVGYYLTPHSSTPLGDFVLYMATNLNQAIDNRGPSSTTTVSLSPGFRTHVGRDWYLLGTVEVPVTNPEPFDYQVLFSLMKVY